jgi:hypothetical protein
LAIAPFAAGSPTTAIPTRRNCVRPLRGSMPMSSGGRVESSSDCATRPKQGQMACADQQRKARTS